MTTARTATTMSEDKLRDMGSLFMLSAAEAARLILYCLSTTTKGGSGMDGSLMLASKRFEARGYRLVSV